MCVETGIGSGSVYYEPLLHGDRATADVAAALTCAAAQAENDAQPQASQQMAAARMGHFQAITANSDKRGRERGLDQLRSEIVCASGAHTPGPWVASGNVNSGDGVFSFDVRGDVLGKRHLVVCSGYGGLSDAFASAEHGPGNAHLIAAAPELLAALVELVDLEGPLPGNNAWHAKATAAIAKAKGGAA